MSRDYNDDEIIEKVEADEDEKNEYNKEDRENGPEKFCFLCRRPESKAGPMIELPNNIHIVVSDKEEKLGLMNLKML